MAIISLTNDALIEHIEEHASAQGKAKDALCQEVLLKCMELKLIEHMKSGQNTEEWGFGSRR